MGCSRWGVAGATDNLTIVRRETGTHTTFPKNKKTNRNGGKEEFEQ